MNIEHVSSDGLPELALLTAIDEHFELPQAVRCAAPMTRTKTTWMRI